MWGTSSPEDKLAGDLGSVIEATSTGGRRSDFFTAENLAPSNLRLLQQYLPKADVGPVLGSEHSGPLFHPCRGWPSIQKPLGGTQFPRVRKFGRNAAIPHKHQAELVASSLWSTSAS
jgi:hypothetical protein